MSKKPRRLSGARHAPGLIICGLWCLMTFVILGYVLGASLSTSRDIFMGTVFKYETGLHWENYATAWSKQKLYLYFFNSLLYAAVAVVGGVSMAAPAAYVLSRYKFPGNDLIKRALITCLSIPSILIILPLYSLFIKFDIQGRIALMVVYACMRVPYSTIFLLNFFETISRTYEEAAAIDGCPSGKIFTKIMLPMVKPAISTISLFGFIGTLNEYMICLLLIPTGNAMSLGVGLARAIKALQYVGNYPAIFSAVVIAVAPSILIYAICSRKIVFGGMGGGIKG
ncbi:MAG: carbohydrate ABC transporter permease [Oscillospiraceae bacterium]|nr:carbohydrate ABC transporter permease [Oscillospiraceae bacterium]